MLKLARGNKLVYNNSLLGLRYYSQAVEKASASSTTNAKSSKIAVVGSGPSAFYTVLQLLKSPIKDLQIDMFEKTPVPFGLVRYGVAPDHPEVKFCQTRFADCSQDERFKFFGNVEIGKDLSVKELRTNYDSILFAYGSNKDKKLGIKGEDSPGVISSKEFVGWYNGDPQYQDLNPPLEDVENVSIIGNGNVTIDIIRILLAPVDKHWLNTDITTQAINKLKLSKVKKVEVFARRGFFESAFTNKEFKELLELNNEGVKFIGWDEEILQPILKEISHLMNRVDKRRLKLAETYSKSNNNNKTNNDIQNQKFWKLNYLKSPVEFIKDEKNSKILKETIFQSNNLSMPEPNMKSPIIKPIDEFKKVKNELVIISTGYKGEPLVGFEEANVPFDSKRGMIPNIDGRVLNTELSEINNSGSTLEDDEKFNFIKGLYTVGWIASGSRGAINSAVMNGSIVGNNMIQDIENFELFSKSSDTDNKSLNNENSNGESDNAVPPVKLGRSKIRDLLNERNCKVVTWDDWLKIEEYEKSSGEKLGKISNKITNTDEMLKICDKL
ncbi:hypothetical protein B5S28_g1121 [[Candida] boidinii]|nr:hypothetical protein B5S28_g1121 [[Candida] boidinii]OWB59759.1 hypothetical protein B5S29_g622 [[Candida] boidinii]OWB79275.1 hypothetical protein B5S32_g3490 [[Candida] boidinii]